MAKVNIFNPEWVEMVFEGKNHDYGAYMLRKQSSKRHLKSLLIGSCVFIGAVTGPVLIKSIIPEKKEQDLTVRMLADIKLDKPTEADRIIKEVAPPPPAIRNTIKFTPPVIKPDEEVGDEEEPKLQKEVVDQKAVVGVVDFDKGTDDVEAPVATENVVTEEEETPFVIVEQMPDFPGGQGELLKFISDNIRYPVMAQENGIQGTVFVSFVVDRNGKVTRVQVSRGVNPALDKEAARVVAAMPDWSQGRQGGRAVSVSYTVPIKFRLQ